MIFYDTTSLLFEINDEDGGDKDGNVLGSQVAGKKSYAAPRQRGHSKNGRSDAPQIVVGVAVTRDGFLAKAAWRRVAWRRKGSDSEQSGLDENTVAAVVSVAQRGEQQNTVLPTSNSSVRSLFDV